MGVTRLKLVEQEIVLPDRGNIFLQRNIPVVQQRLYCSSETMMSESINFCED